MENKRRNKGGREELVGKIVVSLVGAAALLLLVLFIIALVKR